MLVRQTLLAQGWDTYPATLFPAGGLATVIYTDALQTVIMVVGAVILAVKGEVWGWARVDCPSTQKFFRLSHSGSALLLASLAGRLCFLLPIGAQW